MDSMEMTKKGENEKDEGEEALFNLGDEELGEDKQENDDDDDDDDQLLKCSSCKQLFNQPKFLSCAHTFCLQCCEKFLFNSSNKDQIQCPTCQQITHVKSCIFFPRFVEDLV